MQTKDLEKEERNKEGLGHQLNMTIYSIHDHLFIPNGINHANFGSLALWKTSQLCNKIDLHFQEVKIGGSHFDPSHVNNNQYLMKFFREEICAGQGF